jgi:uncharacterized protein YgbK (DUF1537 family)
MSTHILLGCIADDFTGAGDAASFLVQGGMETVLCAGIPEAGFVLPDHIHGVIIALKTRTQETSSAVKDSIHAVNWLLERGAEHIYVKYCSTFDSTRSGNIGPVCDAVLEKLNLPYTLLCPSLPVNKRTVKSGRLYVDGVPLEKTHMSRHPLTPMWDNYIPSLMKDQSKYPCYVCGRETLQDNNKMNKEIETYTNKNERFYLIPDYEHDDDEKLIIKKFGGLPLLTGGSGLMFELGNTYRQVQAPGENNISGITKGKSLVVAGSCSTATNAQVEYYLKNLGKGIMIDPGKLITGEQSVESIWDEVIHAASHRILLYSKGSRNAGDLSANNMAASRLELAMAELAVIAVEKGYTRIIVAGGETSSAVTKALGFTAYEIGESIAPGVPVMKPLYSNEIRLVLKSGNFGQEDFFARALKITGEEL